MAAALLVVSVVAGAGAGAGYVWLERNILSTLPTDLSDFRDWRPPSVCTVQDATGQQIDRFYVERRIWVDIETLPPHVGQAFVAAEDRRFYEHAGVDPYGIGRALLENLSAGEVRQGGSTITQQLVKNLLVGSEKSYERKLKEAVLSYRLEQELSKDQILELFINYVFLGSGNYGVEAAAQDFFGVPASELDPGQAALLAGLIPAPSVYNPRRNPEIAKKRRELVLYGMVAEGFLDAETSASFADAPVLVPQPPPPVGTGDLSYVTVVRREIRRVLPRETVFAEGLTVHTALDPAIQLVTEQAVRAAVEGVDARQGIRGPRTVLPASERDAFLAAGRGLDLNWEGVAMRPPSGRCLDAMVGPSRDLTKLQVGPFELPLAARDRSASVRTERGPVPLSMVVQHGSVLRVCAQHDGTLALDRTPYAQAAAVVIENATGRVIALAGGYDVGLEGFVRATQARRQPGSSFKPYVYASAFLGGRSQLDIMSDAPIALPAGGGKTWSPKNYGGGFAGSMTLRSALARSTNTIAVRLALESRPAEVAKLAKKMGVRTPLRDDPTMALGSSEVTPMDQALGYATIARLGVPTDPVYIDRLVDYNGQQIGVAGSEVLADGKVVATLPGGPLPRVLPSGAAYELVDMMREVVRGGTARRAYNPLRDRMGKTGTTNDFLDAWFVGSTPRYTVAVWVGTDGTNPLGDSETGGRAALPAWIQIVEALPDVDGERFPVPDDALVAPVDGVWMGFRRGRVPASALQLPRVPGSEPLPAFAGRGR